MELRKNINEARTIIIVPKTPVIAKMPISSSGAFSIPKKAVQNIVKKINQKTPKTTPFFLVNIVFFFLSRAASCGKNPPCTSSSDTRPNGMPQREQNFVSFETCCCPQLGQCIDWLLNERSLELKSKRILTRKSSLCNEIRGGEAARPSIPERSQTHGPENGRLSL